MDKIEILFPDGIDIFTFTVTKRNGYTDEIEYSEQADTLEEALDIIANKEMT